MGIRITPSILSADFSRLDEEISRISAVSDLLHLDVMDNVFVPNFTFDFDHCFFPNTSGFSFDDF